MLTLRYNTLRVFIAVCAMLDLEIHVANVNNTFIELFLKEVIYIKALPRVDIPARQCLKIN
jgi:hypothetical protein